MNKVLQDKKAICFFVLPALLVYLTILVYPMITSIVYTFFEGTPNVNMKFVGLTNYKKLFSDREFLNSIIVTGKYFLVTAAGWVILGWRTAFAASEAWTSPEPLSIHPSYCRAWQSPSCGAKSWR